MNVILSNDLQLIVSILLLSNGLLQAQNGEAKAHFETRMKAYEENLLVAASVDFTDAISLWPEYSEAYYYRAECFNRMNRIDQAITDYESTLEHNPDHLMSKIRLIHFYKNRN